MCVLMHFNAHKICAFAFYRAQTKTIKKCVVASHFHLTLCIGMLHAILVLWHNAAGGPLVGAYISRCIAPTWGASN